MGERLTKRQRAVMKEWESHTGFEFMGPDPDMDTSFYAALDRNRRWLEDHTTDALRIGDDIPDPDFDRKFPDLPPSKGEKP